MTIAAASIPNPKLEYGLSPELQRCCWYAIVGMACISVIAIYLGLTIHGHSFFQIALNVAVYFLIAIGLFLTSRWKLLVDETGVWQRRFFRWEVWTWADFASGRILKLDGFVLRDPMRPWWGRTLRMGYLEPTDRFELIEAINLTYQLPPPPFVPDPLRIRFGMFTKLTIHHSASSEGGIEFQEGKTNRRFDWEDLREAHFTRLDPIRRDFVELVLAFPDREFEFKSIRHQGGTTPNWSGATAEQLNEVFFKMLPLERIVESLIGKPLVKIEHVARQIELTRRKFRLVKWTCSGCGIALAGLLLWMAFDNPWQAFAMLIISAVQVGPIIAFAWYNQNSQLVKLRRRFAQLSISKIEHDT